ncbi:DNA repair and recombination protein RAD52 [Nematocida sp. LUAm3]|nr:DNA repair and recombination protein RAD52 [Nematocida sp. LUAm3]KAI5175903.1 DNA repair and recombination protein RAD52 [Nematocida sp. LUAm2]KAI5178715.1 DNA repair and recombination protein RAD52 [Nematocida sp. LUAm1]
MKEDYVGSVLKKGLGPEYIKFRNTGSGEEAYIEGRTAIDLANRIFGYNGWSSEVKEANVLETEQKPSGYTVTVTALVKITIKDGASREDIGIGLSENQRIKGKAIKVAYKSAITDGIKRALRQFGYALGNCCYDREYSTAIKKVTRTPKAPLQVSDLIRPESLIFSVKKPSQQATATHQTESVSANKEENTVNRPKPSNLLSPLNSKVLVSSENRNYLLSVDDVLSSDG